MTDQPYQSETVIDESPSVQPAHGPDEIIANHDRRYRRKHMIFTVALILFALLPRIPLPGFVTNTIGWESLRGFAYDGWIGWPRHNEEVRDIDKGIAQAEVAGDTAKVEELKAKKSKMHKEYTPADILIQKCLAIVLPILGLAYGIWTWHATRGRYRLVGNTLEMPGHGEIPLSDIRSVDKTRWERKGIAVITYQDHHPQRERTFKLDDFAYERDPTDKILERVEAYLAPPPEMGAPSGTEEEPVDSGAEPTGEPQEQK